MATTDVRPAEVSPPDRIRTAWVAAHAPVAGVPRWARIAAYAIPFVVLPSSVWRIAACTFHAPIVRGAVDPATAPSGIPGMPIEVYVIVLSIVSELLAFTAIGLVSAWGEVFPRWLPLLRGRRVPTLFAVIPAVLGSIFLTLLWSWMAISMSLGLRIDGSPATGDVPVSLDDWQGALAFTAYAHQARTRNSRQHRARFVTGHRASVSRAKADRTQSCFRRAGASDDRIDVPPRRSGARPRTRPAA
jgi:hypothetical protein